jgi:hypothetical protein
VKTYRQGDVLILETAAAPTDAVEVPRDKGRIVLAYGEVTGHAHAIHGVGATAVLDRDTQARYLVVSDDAIATLRPLAFADPVDDESFRLQDASGIVLRFAKDSEFEARCASAFGATLTLPGEVVQHEEHDAIVLPPATYALPGQREYTSADMAPMRVAD